MEWNVFHSDFNTGKIVSYNVLKGREEFIKELKVKFASKEEFSRALRSEMMYYYWSKAEWEVLISPWCGRKDADMIKVDVFWQIDLNWDRFVDYCWSFEKKEE